MPLTDAAIRGFKPREKPYREFDGQGLYVEIAPTGSKLWRLKYRYHGRENRLSFGPYPEVKLGEARRKRDAARLQLHEGLDPALERNRAKARRRIDASNTFSSVADEYICKREKDGLAEATVIKLRYFLSHLEPAIGTIPLSDIDPPLLLSSLKQLETRGLHETAKKTAALRAASFAMG